jgi:hypothetical protein
VSSNVVEVGCREYPEGWTSNAPVLGDVPSLLKAGFVKVVGLPRLHGLAASQPEHLLSYHLHHPPPSLVVYADTMEMHAGAGRSDPAPMSSQHAARSGVLIGRAPPEAGEQREVRPAVESQGSKVPRLLHRTKWLATCDARWWESCARLASPVALPSW